MVGEAAGEEEAKYGKPFIGGAGAWLSNLCRAAKIDRNQASIVNCIGCKPPGNKFPTSPQFPEAAVADLSQRLAEAASRHGKESREYQRLSILWHDLPDLRDGHEAVAYCRRHHLEPFLAAHKWRRIVALGGEALESLTPRRGILIWRGSPLPLRDAIADGPRVMPTLHPAYVMRNAGLFPVVVQDLRKSLEIPPEHYQLYGTIEDLRSFTSKRFAFDLEWDPNGKITICGLSDHCYSSVVVPFEPGYINELRRIFESAEALIGHNIIGADTRHLDKLGWRITAEMHDTMLKQHLVQPDFKHDLGFVASLFTNKVFWKGKGEESEDIDGNTIPGGAQWKTWCTPQAIPREHGGYGGCRTADEAYRLYNARDTAAEYEIDAPLSQLLADFELEHTYWNVSVPLAYICRDLGEHGLRIDQTRLGDIASTIDATTAKLEALLPIGLRPYEQECTKQIPAPPGTYKPKTKVCKGTGSTKHLPVNIQFAEPTGQPCSVCSRVVEPGKMSEAKIIRTAAVERIVPYTSAKQVAAYAKSVGCATIVNRKTNRATTGDDARKVWARTHPEFNLLTDLKEQVTLRNNFAKDRLLAVDRMYFNLLVHGTSEGRLSSSGRRKGIDLNIQNQPKEFRCIYVPDEPGWGILDLDIVQGENWLTAWLAKDMPRWERLQTPDFDEHGLIATEFFGKPCYKGTDGEYLRKVGKIINHMKNYGAGWKKLQETLALAGYSYTAADCKQADNVWQKTNAGTYRWQQETIATAMRQGFLRNPFGRVRWLNSRDMANKALAFLPASSLADMVLRMMVAHYPQRFSTEIAKLGLGRSDEIVEGWLMSIQVHDSLVFQGPDAQHLEQARRSAAIMTQPWPELGGFQFKVEASYSTRSWGDGKRLAL